MTSTEALAITCGLGSAITWGAGDFSGGLAAKRSNVFSVILISQSVGIILLIGLAILFSEKIPHWNHLMWGGLAGISGMLGLIALYKSLAQSRMGIAAPVSAVATAFIPVVFTSITHGLPKTTQIMGFGVAILAVWLLTYTDGDRRVNIRELYLPAIAGFGFALFFIFIDKASADAVLWPLVAARIASLSIISALILLRGQVEAPAKRQLCIIALSGILDVAGNAFFVLSAQLGRLDLSAVLSSLYPAATVLLACFILKEKVFKRQWLGVAVTLSALVLLSL